MAITPTAVDTGVPKRKSSGAGGAHMPLQMNLSGRISPMDAMASTPSQFRHVPLSVAVPSGPSSSCCSSKLLLAPC